MTRRSSANARASRILEHQLAALFSAYLFDTPGGDPVLAAELIEFNPGRSKPTAGDAPYVDMAAVPTDNALIREVAVRRPTSGSRFCNGDTLMARITPCLENGKVAYVDCLPDDASTGVGSTEFIVLRPRSWLPPQYAYFLARSARFRDFAVRHMAGSSGRQRCSAEALARFEMRMPTSEAVGWFTAQSVPGCALMRSLLDESAMLTGIRDTLLPPLLSGQLRVRDAEAVTGEAV